MDCHCNESGSRSAMYLNRRGNVYRQNNASSRQRMMGNYHNSRYSSGMNRAERCDSCGRLKSECQCSRKEEHKDTACGCSEWDCDCGMKDRKCVVNAMHATECMPLGMAYIPYQEFESLYEWDTAFCQGTLFADLDKPFLVTDCAQGGGRR